MTTYKIKLSQFLTEIILILNIYSFNQLFLHVCLLLYILKFITQVAYYKPQHVFTIHPTQNYPSVYRFFFLKFHKTSSRCKIIF